MAQWVGRGAKDGMTKLVFVNIAFLLRLSAVLLLTLFLKKVPFLMFTRGGGSGLCDGEEKLDFRTVVDICFIKFTRILCVLGYDIGLTK